MRILFILLLFLISSVCFCQDSRWIDLEWEGIQDAKEYELELFEVTENENFSRGTFKTPDPRWSHAVPPAKYLLRIRSIDDRGVPGEWSEDIDLKVKIVNPLMNRPSKSEKVIESLVVLDWNEVPEATSYQVVIRDSKKVILQNSSILTNKETIYLKDLGIYSWAVFALGVGDEVRGPDEWPDSAFRDFERVGGELEAPEVKISINDRVMLEWKEIENADSFEIDFLPPPGKGAKNTRFKVQEFKYVFPKENLKDGITTVLVKAIAPGYQDSPKTIVKIVKNNDKVTTLEVVTGKSASLK
jgi:hypothetical protein